MDPMGHDFSLHIIESFEVSASSWRKIEVDILEISMKKNHVWKVQTIYHENISEKYHSKNIILVKF